MQNWSIKDSRNTYNIEKWGDGYFDICDKGNLCITPQRNGIKIDANELSRQLIDSGLTFPILIRFLDIIQNRIDRIESAFSTAMTKHDFNANHKIIYPIKVNQQQDVVDEVISQGYGRIGLEAGSKPELIAVLAKSPPDSTVICNGYKDEEYLRLALLGQQMGLKVYIVIEKISEIPLIERTAKQLNIQPLLGIRARLASAGSGNWQNSGGEDSKFGLTSNQILDALKQLSSLKLLPSLQLLHFHIGSQITDITHIKEGAKEIASYFQQISLHHTPIKVIDVGGGLGIDYEGSGSTTSCSINYSVDQYADAIISPIAAICRNYKLQPPDIICECGRAITAQHAVLLTNVIDHDRQDTTPPVPASTTHELITDIKQVLSRPITNVNAAYSNAQQLYIRTQELFKSGSISLKIKANAECLYHSYCNTILNTPNIQQNHPELFNKLTKKLADKLFCNLSIFQSMPDIWGIEQIFPIMPIHKLDKKPDSRAILLDITCDSDGQISEYVDSAGLENSLPVHTFSRGESYILGFFMVGAYQEILGDLHNLFGDTHSVNIKLNANGFVIQDIRKGDTIAEVLKTVNFQPQQVIDSVLQLSNSNTSSDSKSIHADEVKSIIKKSLAEYTYLHPKL